MNLLIVDDDQNVVDRIVQGLDWKEMGVNMTFTANSVQKAIGIIKAYPIHILLTDIEMSQGSGLELLEWVRNRNRSMKCIILSSYATFSYAQKAIELGVSEYLLKPVRFRELEDAIRRVGAGVFDRDEDKKQELYTKIIKEPSKCQKLLSEGIKDKIIERKTEHIILLSIRFRAGKAGEISKTKDTEILDFVVRNVACEFLDAKGIIPEAIIQSGSMEWYLVFRAGPVKKEVLCEMAECFQKYISADVFFYVSASFPLQNIIENREELDEIKEKYLPSADNILYVRDLKKGERKSVEPPWDSWKEEVYGLDNLTLFSEVLEKYLTDLNKESVLTVDWMRNFRKKLIWLVYHLLEQHNMDFSHVFDNERYDDYYDHSIWSVRHMNEFIVWLMTSLDRNKDNSTRKDMVVEALKKYIREHLAEDLSRKQLADIVFMSEDYVGKIFIAATGKSISSYVTEQRMEAARENLEKTSLPVSEVAMMVGYHNFSYFSKNFKEAIGYTPNEYRAKYGIKRFPTDKIKEK